MQKWTFLPLEKKVPGKLRVSLAQNVAKIKLNQSLLYVNIRFHTTFWWISKINIFFNVKWLPEPVWAHRRQAFQNFQKLQKKKCFNSSLQTFCTSPLVSRTKIDQNRIFPGISGCISTKNAEILVSPDQYPLSTGKNILD